MIAIADGSRGETIRAAMRLAAERWGGAITINGSAAFKEQVVRIAVERGLKSRNREFMRKSKSEKQSGPLMSVKQRRLYFRRLARVSLRWPKVTSPIGAVMARV